MLTSLNELPTLPSPQGVAEPPSATPATATSTAPPQAVTAGAITFAQAWQNVQEGDIVRFIARVRRPAFVRVYQILSAAPAKSKLGRLNKKLQSAIGVVPRLPLLVDATVPSAPGEKAKVKLRLVLPAQPTYLSAEPTLFAPRLTLVAKVIERMDEERTYGDLAFSDRFAPLIKIVPSRVLHNL